MLEKLKNNLALVVTGITLLGSIGAGIQSIGAVVNTLQGIDDRMNEIEYRFEELRNETMVSNDIAVLFEKIYALEQIADQTGYFEERVVALETNYGNIDSDLRDLEWKLDDLENRVLGNNGIDSQEYSLQKWEWTDINTKITRIETELDLSVQDQWVIDDIKNRLAYLEAMNHGH